MSVVNGAVVFCPEDCPAPDALAPYQGPVTAEKFTVRTTESGDQVEVLAYFSTTADDKHGVTVVAAPDKLFKPVSRTAKVYKTIEGDPERTAQVGARLCERVAVCSGRMVVGGVSTCPAYNQQTVEQELELAYRRVTED